MRRLCESCGLEWTPRFESVVRATEFFDSTRTWRKHLSDEDGERVLEFMRRTGPSAAPHEGAGPDAALRPGGDRGEVPARGVRAGPWWRGATRSTSSARSRTTPRGVVDPEFRGRAPGPPAQRPLRVSYVWVSTSPTKTMRTRLAYYALLRRDGGGGRRGARPARRDPRPARRRSRSGAVGALMAARHRVPWVFDVRDLWPDVAVRVGELDRRPCDPHDRAARALRCTRTPPASSPSTRPSRSTSGPGRQSPGRSM